MKNINPLIIILPGCLLVMAVILMLPQGKESIVKSPVANSSVQIKSKIPYPVLLMHGIGQKAATWEQKGAVDYLENDLNLNFAGSFHFQKGQVGSDYFSLKTPQQESIHSEGSMDFFTISFSDSSGAIDLWAREIKIAVERMLKLTGTESVILIGFSMGGLAARSYLVHNFYNHSVKRLVTIGTPHLGSPFAELAWDLKQYAKNRNLSLVNSRIIDQAILTLETQTGIPFDSDAIYDLIPPESAKYNYLKYPGGKEPEALNAKTNFLQTLNSKPHPLIEYISIVGKIDLLNHLEENIFKTNLDLIRRGIEIFNRGDFLDEGDGVVGVKSQEMSNVEWFKRNNLQFNHSIAHIGTSHTQHILLNKEILKKAFINTPEIISVEIQKHGKNDILSIDFIDYLPPHLNTIYLNPVDIPGGDRTVKIPGDHFYLTYKNSQVVAHADIILSEFPSIKKNKPITIVIKNQFSRECIYIKEYR